VRVESQGPGQVRALEPYGGDRGCTL
jgi:hypothetical protein